MIRAADSIRRYDSALSRFIKPVIMNFLEKECPRVFGPTLRDSISNALVNLLEEVLPDRSRVKPGQIVWNALDKNTRGDSPNRRYVPVVLTIVDEEDVQSLSDGVLMSQIAQNSTARIIREAYDQGGILSMRDIGLLTWRHGAGVSMIRKKYEEDHKCILPHTGVLHDMGSSISHKNIITRKAILERKDPAQVARECQHSQGAVDRYLKDYHRVRTLYNLGHDVDFINLATQLAKHVVQQYITIIKEEKKAC